MSIAHAESSSIEHSDDDIDEEEFYTMVSRDELRTMVDQVSKMYAKWDQTQADLAQLRKNDMLRNARVIELEGRMALVERGTPASRPDPRAEFDGTLHEVTERRQNVRVPIPRATELLDKERMADEMIAKYQWWSKKARALGVTARQIVWGFFKEASKYAAAGSIGWAIHHYWPK